MSGYSVSLVALLISIFILGYFRALHCTRNILHINLFTSFSINNLLWLIWYLTVVPVPEVVAANGIWCQVLHVITHYFMLTNYFWMLCEGFYLHSLLAFAFILEEQLLKYVYVLGWLVPVLIIALYASLRIFNNENRDCWIDSAFSPVLIGPVVVSLCINFVFLISILRVLLMKIKTTTGKATAGTQGQNQNELIKVFRAAFVLVPLLGLHYVIILVRPDTNEYWEHGHEILSAVSASYQGLCVACLFCFFNNEVHAQIKRKWYQFRDIQNNQVFSTVTGSTYALERRVSVLPNKATRSSSTIHQQGNEISPMLTRYQDTSPLEMDELKQSTLESPNGAASMNGLKKSILHNKKPLALVAEPNFNNHSNIRILGSDFVESISMKPLIKTKTANGNDRLYVDTNDIAEDYV